MSRKVGAVNKPDLSRKRSSIEESSDKKPSSLHPLIKKAKRALEQGKKDQYGRCRIIEPNLPDIVVYEPNVERALKIFSLLLQRMEAVGITIQFGEHRRYRRWHSGARMTFTYAVLKGTQIQIHIEERSHKAMAPKEPDGAFQWRKIIYKGCGRLTLVIQSFTDYKYQGQWDLGEKGWAEEQINTVVREIVAIADHEERLRPERERKAELDRIEWEKIEKEREEKRLYEKKVKMLHEKTSQWKQVDDILSYATYLESVVLTEAIDDGLQLEIRKWIEFAREYVQTVDLVPAFVRQELQEKE